MTPLLHRHAVPRPPLRERTRAAVFVLPAIILFGAFVVYPLVSGLYYSLFQWPGYGVPQYIGLHNFINLVSDPQFLMALRVTLIYTVCTTVLQTVVPIVLPWSYLVANIVTAPGDRWR